MKEIICGTFVLIVGISFLVIGIFKFENFYKRYKEFNQNKIDIYSFRNDYWFIRILLIFLGILLIISISYSYITGHFN